MLKLLKELFKQLPGIRRIVAQRDMLHLAVIDVTAQRDRSNAELNEVRVQLEEKLTRLRETRSELEQAQAELRDLRSKQGFVPPGHFYSPVPALDEIREDEQRIFENHSQSVAGVEINAGAQLELLDRFTGFYREMPFKADKQEGFRYYFENPAYSYSDAIFLHCMIRDLKPERIIEIGSGFSSCMILDTNDLYFDGSIETTFIEPYPELLMSLLRDTDIDRVKVIPKRLQDVDLKEFDALKANDILFIDSTHVSKIGSDVNRILFEVLPCLAKGVYVHFHDIFFPFEYPRDWVFEGRAWNEAYLLRAFLQFNQSFSVVLMNTYLRQFHETYLQENMPLCLTKTGSIWLRRE